MLLRTPHGFNGFLRSRALGNQGAVAVATTPSYGVRAVVGNNEFLSIADASQTGLDLGTGDFSAAIWFYADTLGIIQRLLGKKNTAAGNDAGWYLGILATDVLQARIADGAGIVSVNHGTTLSANTLYLAIVNYDRDGNCGVSLNAGAEATGSIAARSASVSNAVAFNIANIANAATNTFDGGLVCAGVWNQLLDATARTALYNGGVPLLRSAYPVTIPTPVDTWDLNEQSDGSGPVTRVSYSGLNNLTDNNTTPSSAFPFTG